MASLYQVLPDANSAADDAAGPAYTPNEADILIHLADPNNSSRPPRRGLRTKRRRNTCNDNPNNEEGGAFEVDIHDDESSANSYAISTEVGDALYFDEIEKLINEAEENNANTCTPTSSALRPTVSIVAKMQARLLSKHLKTRRLRRVVSHSAASSMQNDVDVLNEVSGTGSSATRSKMRAVFSFSDMRQHRESEEHQMLTDRILENIAEEEGNGDEEFEGPAPNAEFGEFILDGDQEKTNADIPPHHNRQATLKPHPNMLIKTKNTGPFPFFPQLQPGGLRRANSSDATYMYAASAAGQAVLSSPSPSKSMKIHVFPDIAKPKAGNLRRSNTDSLTHVGGTSSDRNSRKIKEVTVEDFYDLLRRWHQSPTL